MASNVSTAYPALRLSSASAAAVSATAFVASCIPYWEACNGGGERLNGVVQPAHLGRES